MVDLINVDTRTWKKELVVNTFPEVDAARIFHIPLAMEVHDDPIVWHGEPSEEFSAHSAYKLLQNFPCNPNAYALQTNYKNFYKQIWSLNPPSRIKITLWRISWNFLPTLAHMQVRKLVFIVTCPQCGRGTKNLDHLFRFG